MGLIRRLVDQTYDSSPKLMFFFFFSLPLCPLLSFLLLPAHDRRFSPVVTKPQSRSACETDGVLGWGAED